MGGWQKSDMSRMGGCGGGVYFINWGVAGRVGRQMPPPQVVGRFNLLICFMFADVCNGKFDDMDPLCNFDIPHWKAKTPLSLLVF